MQPGAPCQQEPSRKGSQRPGEEVRWRGAGPGTGQEAGQGKEAILSGPPLGAGVSGFQSEGHQCENLSAAASVPLGC